MKTSVTMLSVGDVWDKGKIDVEGFIKYCAGLGVDGVELTEHYWKDREAELKGIPGWLKENKIALAIFSIGYAPGGKFTTNSEQEINKQVDYIKRGIDTALMLGLDKLRIVGGNHNELSREEAFKRLRAGLERCVPYAEKNKVTLAIENHGDMPGLSSDILELSKGLKSEYFKCTLDTANFMFENMTKTEDLVSATKNLVGHVAHVHAKDIKYDKDNHTVACVAGEGFIPFKECFQILKDNNYKGYISVEFEDRTIDGLDGTKRSTEYIKKTLKELV